MHDGFPEHSTKTIQSNCSLRLGSLWKRLMCHPLEMSPFLVMWALRLHLTLDHWTVTFRFLQMCCPCMGSKFQAFGWSFSSLWAAIPDTKTHLSQHSSWLPAAPKDHYASFPESVFPAPNSAKLFLRQNLCLFQDTAVHKQDTVEYLLKHGNEGPTLGLQSLFFTSWEGRFEKSASRGHTFVHQLENKTNNNFLLGLLRI